MLHRKDGAVCLMKVNKALKIVRRLVTFVIKPLNCCLTTAVALGDEHDLGTRPAGSIIYIL